MGAMFKKPKAPELPPVVAMPMPDDELIAANKRRKLTETRGRGGRQSTMLSERETLG